MQFTETRSHELRIRVDLSDSEAFAHHKRFASGITINVTQVRVTATYTDDHYAHDDPHIDVSVFGHGILKDGNLGAPRDDRHVGLDALPVALRRNVAAHIRAFGAQVKS